MVVGSSVMFTQYDFLSKQRRIPPVCHLFTETRRVLFDVRGRERLVCIAVRGVKINTDLEEALSIHSDFSYVSRGIRPTM